MSGRIIEMRRGLQQRLEAKGTPGSWDHITSQIGMFSFTGLNEQQVQTLREKWHIYMVFFPPIRMLFNCNANPRRPRTAVYPWRASTLTTLIISPRRWIIQCARLPSFFVFLMVWHGYWLCNRIGYLSHDHLDFFSQVFSHIHRLFFIIFRRKN
jgi:hypothetical protein